MSNLHKSIIKYAYTFKMHILKALQVGEPTMLSPKQEGSGYDHTCLCNL